MLLKKISYLFLSFVLIPNALLFAQVSPENLVNPFIGTGGHGHTFPGPTLPFGMVQLSPDTRIDGSWDGCSGYHYSDSLIYGFSHTHLSGTGCSDYGDIAFLPIFSTTKLNIDQKVTPAVSFSHASETAQAGYYKVQLKNGVTVELTSSLRVGLQRYTFTKSGKAAIILNLKHRDELLEGSIHQQSTVHFSGIRRSKAWAKNQVLFYDFEMNTEPEYVVPSKGAAGDEQLILFYTVKAGQTILIKTGISAVDENGALNNRTLEMPNWNFESVKEQAKLQWKKELSKVTISQEDPNKATIFYTSLYHTMIHPSLYSDVDNRYRGRDNKIHSTEGKFDYYTVFSLWDTYRAEHPLLTIIDPKRTNDFINTFLCQYQQGGKLPVWELSSNETDCMIGYHSVSVIWDAYSKGIRGFDANLALEAMKHSAMENDRGLSCYKTKGYVSSEEDNESVSKTLEYAYDDWCIGQFALALNKESDYHAYMNRSEYWKNLIDPTSRFFVSKKNASFIAGFDPYEVNQNYTEANAWQYSLSVPQDLQLLNTYFSVSNRLEQLFTANEKTNGRKQADISGLIGQYAHGNEPSHHLVYALGVFGSKEKNLLRKYVDQIANNFYKNDPDGLIGNEDCGQMSAWYVLSAIGIYPLCPGNNKYILGSPQFKEIKVQTGANESFAIYSNKKNGLFLNSIEWNKKVFPSYITHQDLKNATIRFKYSSTDKPMVDSITEAPFYSKNPFTIPIVPYFNNPSTNFTDSFLVEIGSIDNSPIYYAFGSEEKNYTLYKKPFYIYNNCTLTAYTRSEVNKEKSQLLSASFVKIPSNRHVAVQTKYDNQYTAGGDNALIDLQRGTANWRIGNWQGYGGKDFIAVVDLGSSKKISKIGLGCLQDEEAWVMMPKQVDFEGSTDGVHFEIIQSIQPNVADTIERTITKDVVTAPTNAYRYYRVHAHNYGKLPAWHWSKFEPAWLFVDEIIIEEEK